MKLTCQKIEPESEQASRSNSHVIGNTESREMSNDNVSAKSRICKILQDKWPHFSYKFVTKKEEEEFIKF